MKKLLLVTVFLSLSIFFFPRPVLALSETAQCESVTCPNYACPREKPPKTGQACTDWCHQTYCPFNTGYSNTDWFVEDPVSTGKQLINAVQNPNQINNWMYRLNFLTGTMSQLSMAGLGPVVTDENGKPISAGNGVAGFLASNIDTLINTHPASSIDYIAYELNNLKVPGSPQTAYAAGSSGYGFKSLNFILPFWTVARNLAYIVFAIIFIVIGIMIMFRIKIDPKTAASIQNALPKMIFALILVTFSYAIAGFLIDIMYVLMALVFTIFAHLPNYTGVAFTPAIFEKKILVQNNSIFDFYLNGPGVAANVNAALAIFKLVFFWFTNPSNFGQNGATLTDNPLVGIVFGAVGIAGGAIAGVLAFFIIMIMILWALFRTWLSLLGAYINILLAIISAPILFMMDAIPGQNQFANWLRGMMGNLLVFPLVTIMLLLGAALTESHTTCNVGETFIPPLIGSGCGGPFLALIGLGIILTTPKAINILQEALKAPPFKYGSAWMEAAKVGAGWGEKGFRRGVNEYLGERADVARAQYENWLKAGGKGARPVVTGILTQVGLATGATRTQRP